LIMPKKLEEMVRALIKRGKTEKQAWAIATAQYKKMQARRRKRRKK